MKTRRTSPLSPTAFVLAAVMAITTLLTGPVPQAAAQYQDPGLSIWFERTSLPAKDHYADVWLDCANKGTDLYGVEAVDSETDTPLGGATCAETPKKVATVELTETDLARTVYGAALNFSDLDRLTGDVTASRAQYEATVRWVKTGANTASVTVAVDGQLGIEKLRIHRNGAFTGTSCLTGNSCTHEVTDIAAGLGDGDWSFDFETTATSFTSPQAMPAMPTVWPAGPVITQLRPSRCPDGKACTSTSAADPVDTMTGTFWESFTDLAVDSRGPGLSWGRHYATDRAATTGPLGNGWTHDWAWAATVNVPAGTATVTDPRGNATPYTRQPDETWTGPGYSDTRFSVAADSTARLYRGPVEQTYAFDASGRLVSVTDRNGEVLVFTYTSGNLTGIAGQSGQSLTVTWTSGRVTKVADQSGRQVLYGYTGTDLTSVTDADGYVWGYGYDTSHRVTSMTDPETGTVTNTYDTSGRVETQTSPLGGVTTFAYDGTAWNGTGDGTTTTSNPDGKQTRYEFTNRLLVSQTERYGTSLAQRTVYGYDPATLAHVLVDDAGRALTREVDSRGNTTKETLPDGATTTTVWNTDNKPTQVTGPTGSVTSYTYDTRGNLLTVTEPGGATGNRTTTLQRTNASHPGDVTAVVDPAAKTTSFQYDAQGRPTLVTDRTGRRTATAYDLVGNPTAVTSEQGVATTGVLHDFETTTTWSGTRLPKVVTDPLGHATTTTYTKTGLPKTVTDAASNVTTVTYNPAGQVTKTVTGTKVEETFYDTAGRMTKQRDGAGKDTLYEYDPATELLSSTTDPDGKTTTVWGRNTWGEPVSVGDPAGRTTQLAYDPAGRVLSRTVDGVRYATYVYDLAGRRTSAASRDGIPWYTQYDNAGQVTKVDAPGTARDVAFGYDQRGRQTSITYPDTGGGTVTRAFDDEARMTGLTDWASRAHAWTYDPDGNPKTHTRPGGTVTTTNTYDNAARPTSLVTKAGATTRGSFGYGYDNRDALNAITPTGTAVTGDTTRSLTFDAAVRLGTDGSKTYGWDNSSNLKTVPGQTGRTFSNGGRLTAATVGTTTYSYAYSLTGARTARTGGGQTLGYAYDAEDRLAQFTPATGAATVYTYDADGVRQSKQTGTAAAETFLWDTSGGLPLLLQDGTNRYLYGPDGQLVQQTATTSGATVYPVTDLTGSVRALVDGTGAVKLARTWDAYGNQTATTGTGATSPFAWAGEYRDAKSGLTTSVPATTTPPPASSSPATHSSRSPAARTATPTATPTSPATRAGGCRRRRRCKSSVWSASQPRSQRKKRGS